MIAAERFKAFDETRNVGLASLQDLKASGSDIYNTVTNKLNEVTGELQAIAAAVKQGAKTPLEMIRSKVDSAVRFTRDTFSALQDLTKFGQKQLEDFIGGLLPDIPGLKNAFRTLTTQCRDNAASRTPGFKKFNDNFNCGTNSGKCSSGEVNNLLGKATGGLFNQIANTFQSMLRSLIALASIGYSAGACKLFTALINGLPDGVVQRGAAGVLALVGGEGNATAVMDIASSIHRVNPSKEIPGLVGRIADNLTTPAAFGVAKLDQLYTGITDSFSVIQPNYDKSEVDGTATVANMGHGLNTSMASSARAYLKTTQFTSMDVPVVGADYSLASTYAARNTVSDPFANLGFA